MSFVSTIPFYIGIIVIIKYLFKIFDFLRKYIFISKNNLKEKYGEGFVVITGGSSGIGFSFAKEFLKMKFKV